MKKETLTSCKKTSQNTYNLISQYLILKVILNFTKICNSLSNSQKIGEIVGSYPPSIYLPLFIENKISSWGLQSLYKSTSIHRKQDRQLGLTLLLYLYLYSQKTGQVVGSYTPFISLPLIIAKRTGSYGLPSLYISTSIHRKQDRYFGLTLPLYIYLYSQKIGQVVEAYILSIYLRLLYFREHRRAQERTITKFAKVIPSSRKHQADNYN